MTDPTKQDIINGLAKFQGQEPRPNTDWMDREMIAAIDTMVSIAFEGLWPADDPRHINERAAAAFTAGFAVGRDFEQTLAFNAQFGHTNEGESE